MTQIAKETMVDVSRRSVEDGVANLIDHAVKLGASDLYLVCNEQHIAVLVRHLGIVRPISIVPLEQGRRFLSHIKANAGMDVAEKRRPLDGRWIFEKDDGEAVDLRINVIPTLYGEDFAIRLLERGSQLYVVENLGMMPEQLAQYLAMIGAPGGLILITGPTGSGKTTTLYSSLIRLNNGQRKINTIENPIEYAIDGMRQSEVNAAIGVGFAELLRGVLRQSPDVIMIGEIRDAETARTAVHAANSGILVFATSHAPSAAAAIGAMRNLDVPSHFLAMSLRGVVSQRLVRTLCPNCKTAFDISDSPQTFEEIKPWLKPGQGSQLWAHKGCEQCDMVGYTGRTGVFEILAMNREIRGLISDGAPAGQIRRKAMEQRMPEFRQSALLKVAQGETSTEEVFRVIPAEHLLLND